MKKKNRNNHANDLPLNTECNDSGWYFVKTPEDCPVKITIKECWIFKVSTSLDLRKDWDNFNGKFLYKKAFEKRNLMPTI